jgi:hypothetical protein
MTDGVDGIPESILGFDAPQAVEKLINLKTAVKSVGERQGAVSMAL